MRCSKAQSYLSQALDEHLPADVTLDLDRHLDDCADCRVYREDLVLGQRLLAASEPELPENFEWKLQLRLNQALREAAGENLFPWTEDAAPDRWAFLRNFGAATAVGLAAVLALAMVLGPDGGTTQPAPSGWNEGAPLAAGGVLDGSRTELYTRSMFGGPGRTVATGGGALGFRQRSPLLDSGWSGGLLQDGQTILRLRDENRRLRTMLFQKGRELETMQSHLDTVQSGSLDLEEAR